MYLFTKEGVLGFNRLIIQNRMALTEIVAAYLPHKKAS